jgi:hypothetical protein
MFVIGSICLSCTVLIAASIYSVSGTLTYSFSRCPFWWFPPSALGWSPSPDSEGRREKIVFFSLYFPKDGLQMAPPSSIPFPEITPQVSLKSPPWFSFLQSARLMAPPSPSSITFPEITVTCLSEMAPLVQFSKKRPSDGSTITPLVQFLKSGRQLALQSLPWLNFLQNRPSDGSTIALLVQFSKKLPSDGSTIAPLVHFSIKAAVRWIYHRSFGSIF